MSYTLGSKSLSNLVGVHPELGFAVVEAIKITRQDFTAFDGVRNLSEQEAIYGSGASKTMDSYHLYGLAVDLVPWIGGKARWEEDPCRVVGIAMTDIIKAHGLAIEWGWDIWGWDGWHYQMTGYKDRYDIREFNQLVAIGGN